MNIHESAKRGEIAGIEESLRDGVSIDALDEEGWTPLMRACESDRASAEVVRRLIALGADVNALVDDSERRRREEKLAEQGRALGIEMPEPDDEPCSRDSVLGIAAKHATLDKIEALLAAGADATYIAPRGYTTVLLHAVYGGLRRRSDERLQIIRRLIDAGSPLDAASEYGETPIGVAARGDFEVVRLLRFEFGADDAALDWNELCYAAALGDLEQTRQLLVMAPDEKRAALDRRDRRERTPFLLAVVGGSIEVAALLRERGDKFVAIGHYGCTALIYAIENRNETMAKWLIDEGADVNQLDQGGGSPLHRAAETGAVECVRSLLEAGADVGAENPIQENAMSLATHPDIVALLAARGEWLDDVQSDMRRKLAGHDRFPELPSFDPAWREYLHPRRGSANPERANNPLWEAMVRCRQSAYAAANAYGLEVCREAVWCFDRFGHTMTRLPDGRLVEIGGEHEDFYDPDFYIYNDVVVHRCEGERMTGQFEIYGYPQEVFPPTDFHSATLLGDRIYIIGCLGYCGQRVEGITPIYRLDIETFAIESIACSGEPPGWIHKHRARLVSDRIIEVTQGEILRDGKFVPNEQTFQLDTIARMWRAAPPSR